MTSPRRPKDKRKGKVPPSRTPRSFRVKDETQEAMEAQAAALGVSVSEFVRRAIEAALATCPYCHALVVT